MRIKLIVTIGLLLILVRFGYAQDTSSVHHLESVLNGFSTEELNGKLTSYVKLISNNITSSASGYKLNVSLIAFKDSSRWKDAANYLRPGNRFLRNTQIGLGVNHTKKFDDATAQFTIALLNKRDSTIFVYLNPKADKETLDILRNAELAYNKKLVAGGLSQTDADKKSQDAYVAETNYLSDPDTNKPDKDFDAIANSLVKSSMVLSAINLKEAWLKQQQNFKDYAKLVQRKPLWTLYPYGSYDYTYTGFDKAGIGSTLLISLDNNVKHNPFQLDIEGNVYYGRDSTKASVNMDKKIAALSVGINYVIQTNSKGQSVFEAKFAGSIDHNWQDNVKQNTPDADLTVRYNLFKDFWIPLDIKYDSTKKGIFGYVSITCNLTK